jgi:hypothetical protein
MKKMLAVVAAASLVAVAAPAFAANPFSDVPMNHWAYDAVEQMAAKGILEGYPNGTFKGNRAMTRYEIAQMVARMMANGVGGADADKLKALIVEFAPELEALGVKVDGFDGRLSALEKGVGGWRLSGQMRFDVFSHKYGDKNKPGVGEDVGWKGNGSQFNRARLFLHKDLSDKVSFDARWHGGNFDRYWMTAKDFMGAQGLTLKLGQFSQDFEGRDNLYQNNNMWDDDANFLDGAARGVNLNYTRGAFEIEGFYDSGAGNVYADNGGNENFGARIAYNGPKFRVSANGMWFNGADTAAALETHYYDGGTEVKAADLEAGKEYTTSLKYGDTLYGMNYKAYYFALGFKPFKGVDLTGAYYMEKLENDQLGKLKEDDPKAWKIILDISQDVLKFTSLRAEFGKYDGGWFMQNGSGPMSFHAGIDKDYTGRKKAGQGFYETDTKFFKVSAIQKWGAKFSTYERYVHLDQDADDSIAIKGGKAKELQFGIGYQYSPNLQFLLDWTKRDGTVDRGTVKDFDDKVLRFRTVLNF